MPVYKDTDGRWRYRFTLRGDRYGGTTPKGANTKKAAELLERQAIDKVMARRFTGVMPTVAEFVDQFLEHQRAHVKPLTVELNETQLTMHVVPHVGRMKLDAIGRRDLDGLVALWSKDAAPTTVKSRLGTMMRMLGLAVEWEILVAAPKARALKIAPVTPRFLTEAEATELLAASRYVRDDANDWHSMILVGLRTGLRVGELRGLQWADVSLRVVENEHGKPVDVGAVHVRRTDAGRAAHAPTSPKSNSTRIVPLTPDAVRCLRARLESERKRLGDRWSPGTWVWPSPIDHTRTVSTVTCQSSMERYTRRAKLVDVSWHTLRHTFASWLVMRGVPLRAVQELLGHHDMKMTMRYAHLSPGFAHAAAVASLDFPLMSPDAAFAAALPPGTKTDTNEHQPALPAPAKRKPAKRGAGRQRAAKAPRGTPKKPI